MSRPTLVTLATLAILISVCTSAFCQGQTMDPALAGAVAWADRIYSRAITLPPPISSRDLYSAALNYCEARVHPERLQTLFEVGAKMQDRDPDSRTYGNFWWNWSDGFVGDHNAVDFCMQSAVLIWIKHRDWVPEPAMKVFRETLDYAIEGSLRHTVAVNYTNIVFMNACNLILLGENLDLPKVAEEGYTRLKAAVAYTCRYGTHEFCSPTYYEVDLLDLSILEEFCKRDTEREQARAMLTLLWTDVACNWFPAANKLGGAQSRTYDYVRGLGGLENRILGAGWVAPRPNQTLYKGYGYWQPPEALRVLNQTRFPRLVEQTWGPSRGNFRVHYMMSDISLSVLGSPYGGWMDMPLTVDVASDRNDPRCYFIPDGREDPYGKTVIAAGDVHKKTFHLQPFWTGNQRTVDAVGMAIYRDRDIPVETKVLASHFVMPRKSDGFWIGDQKVALDGKDAVSYPVPAGTAVVMRRGTTAMGLRVLWARDVQGANAPTNLVYDGNGYGCARLTVTHYAGEKVPLPAQTPAVALWVRIGSGLQDDAAFDTWRKQFASAAAEVQADAEKASFRVQGVDGPVAVASEAPWTRATACDPPPTKSILALDGKDIGGEIMNAVRPPMAPLPTMPATVVPQTGGAYVEAETGFVDPQFVVGEDPLASGGKFVWTPGKPGQIGAVGMGSVTWRFQTPVEGKYYLWGRVLSPTPDDDSFFFRAYQREGGDLTGIEYWPLSTHTQWEWVPMAWEGLKPPMSIRLPAGDVYFELTCREDGAAIDRLFITMDPKAKPE